jgi:preprotein translocase subunit SecE
VAEDKEREEGQERPSRPVTAAARRERRARPESKDTGVPGLKGDAKPEGKASTRTDAKRGADKKADKAKADVKSAKSVSERKGKATPVRDRKADRPNIFARLGRFLREVVSELRKVIWPTRKQMVTYSVVVLIFLVFMVALVAGLDVGLAKLVFLVFGD